MAERGLQAHIAFMTLFSKELRDSGELVSAEGLAFPSQAKLVRAGKDGEPITDGVFPESKEFLAGYWIVDVDSPERAYTIAARASEAPGPGGTPLNMPIEVRPVMSGHATWASEHAAERSCDDRPSIRRSVRASVARTCAAGARRRRSPFSRLLLGRGCGAGGHDRGLHAMAAGGYSRQSTRLVDSGCVSPHDRPGAQRNCPPREGNGSGAEAENLAPVVEIESDMDPDDTLILLFMCCHPALTSSSAIALTLRAVGGLTTAEIANAFLVPEATMAQRISRAKQTIKASGVPFRLPSPQERAERLPAVLHVLYLIFNEGYASSIGAHLQRLDLAREAIRLTRSAKTLLRR